MGQGLINGGFFIFDRRIFNYLADDENVILNLAHYKK